MSNIKDSEFTVQNLSDQSSDDTVELKFTCGFTTLDGLHIHLNEISWLKHNYLYKRQCQDLKRSSITNRILNATKNNVLTELENGDFPSMLCKFGYYQELLLLFNKSKLHTIYFSNAIGALEKYNMCASICKQTMDQLPLIFIENMTDSERNKYRKIIFHRFLVYYVK
eukprot:86251_1